MGSAGTGTATGLAFSALSKSLVNQTDVVAVHLYDARLDSDGGAWTDRPFASWYWETLGTTTRGATRRFPKVAGIVARAASVTIYDLHDLDATGVPRMWMVFNANTSNAAVFANAAIPINSIFAVNGRLFVTSKDTAVGGLSILDFVQDVTGIRINDTTRYFSRNIANRNVAVSTQDTNYYGAGNALVSRVCSHVHARVIPGGPLDSAGLPIPTVAVATAGGVSVIHPNGAVYSVTDARGAKVVHLAGDGRLAYGLASAGYGCVFGRLLYATIAVSPWTFYFAEPGAGAVRLNQGAPSSLVAGLIATREGYVTGNASGLTLLSEDIGNPANGMTAYVTTLSNTGWQPGDIRGAHLCDTTTGNITGSADLVTNGDFSGGTTGWTAVNATPTVTSGEMQVSSSAGGGLIFQTLTTVPGQTYSVTALARCGTSSAARLIVTPGGVAVQAINNTTSNQPLQLQFTAVAATTDLQLATGTVGTAIFDNVSCRLALPDRSYKGKGLVVNGTLGRTALPCGLAAVSGFSASNYLEQPYNPDYDFGTGDFFIGCWSNVPAGVGQETFFSRAAFGSSYSGSAITLGTGAGGATALTVTDDGFATLDVATASGSQSDGLWHFLVGLRRANVFELWIDGVLSATTAVNNANLSLSNSAATTRIGLRQAGDFVNDAATRIAALRVSAYAPTPAQIRKMYEDERALIVGGTPATLGGTSNSVTALAANEGDGTLAVGTGDGVSIMAFGRVRYLDGASGGAAIGNDAITALSASGSHMLVGTSANAGIISDSVIAQDRMLPAGPPVPRAASDPQVIRARVVTTDATPTDMVPRLIIGEREAVTVDVTVQARTYGATSTQGGTYRRLARYIRDAGGNVTLAGSVQTIGADQETTAGMDVTIQADTAAQTITPRVTGVAGTRMVWTARIVVTRISEEASYAA
ncbi:hypothetical protein C0V82_16000 [Niveispirillum cyanobacteriorum]|uniref:LamG-like jellyroll fold domain-containing protein n=1 Tax=Niveispirillum cyanobacteriorum TaxID=1612173 RepID=A0A2K9NFN3_9PROT|nr:hypothetical protein C0V82_16000 [Niveispirillum cyanobacteriorum]